MAALLAAAACALTAAGAATPGLETRPLAPRTHPRGATMFATLDAARTGIATDNPYADPKMWGDRYQEFALGAIGTGVAIGDTDGDSRPDVFIVSKTGQSRLFRNLGDWRFEDVTARAGLVAGDTWTDTVDFWKQGASFADVNNDGRLDLYVCRFRAPNLLFINQGDGTFREEAAARSLALADASCAGAFCDYDRDGWLDVYVQTNMLDAVAHPDGRPDRLYRNTGDGFFTDVTDAAGISGETLGHSAIWWDYDADGWPDLYVANDFATPDQLYRNNRDGTFTNRIHEVVPHMPLSSMGSDLGDVNNDGRLDFLVADMAPTSHVADQRGMAAARNLARDDTDRPGVAPQYLRNMLYLATGTPHMHEGAYLAGLAASDWTWTVRFEDLDNDGRLDLYITNGMNREHQNADMRQRIFAAINPADRLRIMRDSPVLAEANLAFRNLGDLRFEPVGPAWGLDLKGVSFGAALGDLDGDGDLDIVHTNYEAPATVLRNDSDSGHRLVVSLRGTRSNRHGVGATVRLETAAGPQVRTLVLSRGYISTSEPVLHFGLGDTARVDRLHVSWPSGHTQVFENIGADQYLTITEPAAPAPAAAAPPAPAPSLFADVSEARLLAQPTREKPLREAGQQPLAPFTFARRGPGLAVADIDADGRDDLVLGGTTADPARILVATTAGPFAAREASALANTTALDDGPLLVFDADGDGDTDLLLTRAGTALSAGAAPYQPRLLLNDPASRGGAFTPAPPDALPPLPISVGAVAAADFDRDGRLDLFLGARVLPGKYPLTPRSALLRNHGGHFTDETDTLAPALREAGLVTSALWTDADADGWLDLLVATEWGHVRLFRNRSGAGFEDVSVGTGFAAAGTGWWTSLAAADFNRDGRLDYVAGNVGLNTPYRASPEEPAVMYYGAFATGTVAQVIDTIRENGRLYPRRMSKDLAAKIPAIRKKFPLNDDFARATLGEVLGEDRLAAAQRYAATEFRHGVFVSQPDGTWAFSPLPRIAQIAPIQGLVAGDFDGDGLADIVAVHNSHAPIPFIGRFSGGLGQWLRGDGRGGFAAVEPAVSGLVVPGDAKALVTLDLDDDGAPDLVVSRNNSSTLAFLNRPAADRRFLRIILVGPAGNRTAIGARVTVALCDGSRQVVEVQAGSGYYSQSSSACFLGYGADNPPAALEVRWPSGVSSRHDIPADGTSLRIDAP